MAQIPVVDTLDETDLFRVVITSEATLDEKQITLADLRADILSGGTFINLSNTPSGNCGLYIERTDPPAPLALWIRNMASTSPRYPEINATNYAGATQGYPHFTLYNIPGSHEAPAAPPSNFPLGTLSALSHDSVVFDSAAAIAFRTGAAWTPASHGGEIVFMTTGNGQTGNPVERIRIKHDGSLSLCGQTDTGSAREFARLRVATLVVMDALFTTKSTLSASDHNAERDVVGIGANGSATLFGVHDKATNPPVQPVLATGAGRTVDDVIAALQAIGLVRQS